MPINFIIPRVLEFPKPLEFSHKDHKTIDKLDKKCTDQLFYSDLKLLPILMFMLFTLYGTYFTCSGLFLLITI